MSSFLSSLCILEINPLSDLWLVKIFTHSVGCCFVLFTMSFALQKLFNSRRSHLLIVTHSVYVPGVIFRKWYSVPVCSSLLLTCFSIRTSVTGFMLRSWSTWTWVLWMEIDDLFANFSWLTSSYTSNICWRWFFFFSTVLDSLSKIRCS